MIQFHVIRKDSAHYFFTSQGRELPPRLSNIENRSCAEYHLEKSLFNRFNLIPGHLLLLDGSR